MLPQFLLMSSLTLSVFVNVLNAPVAAVMSDSRGYYGFTKTGFPQQFMGVSASVSGIFFCKTNTTAMFPLCPKMAQLSYETLEMGRNKLVNRFVVEEAQRRKVEIRPLSYFVAEFRGPKSQIKWFQKHYAEMLCSFNPDFVPTDETTYGSCMAHAQEWMMVIESGKQKELMHEKYMFCPSCCTAK